MNNNRPDEALNVGAMLAEWSKELQNLTARREALDERIAVITLNVQACERVLEADAEKRRAQFDGGTYAHVDIEQVARCATQMDAAVLIARASGGIVRVSEAGRLIHAAGLSRGKVTSVIATLSNRMNNGDEWEYEEPGTFRYLLYHEDASQDDAEEDEWQRDENYLTDGGDESPDISQESPATPVAVGQITV